MIRKKKDWGHEGVKKKRQFHMMVRKLHQMLQSLGQCNYLFIFIESVGDGVIKMDQFQKLRRAFTSAAQVYQSNNKQIKNMPDRVIRAQIMFRIMQNKKIMEQVLQQMTNLCMKLKQKISKQQVKQVDRYKTPTKRRRQFQQNDDILVTDKLQTPRQQVQQKSSLQKQLQYKNLTLFNLQRVYFKLIGTQRKEVYATKNAIRKNKYANLQQLKKQAQNKKLIQQIEDQEQENQLEERQMLEAIKMLDDQIQSKMDGILEGIDKMNYNAIGISGSIGQIHQKILINLNYTSNNQKKLVNAQKMLDQVTPYARKPSCICNVVLYYKSFSQPQLHFCSSKSLLSQNSKIAIHLNELIICFFTVKVSKTINLIVSQLQQNPFLTECNTSYKG